MSLRKALFYAGASRNVYYYEDRKRTVSLDPVVTEKARQIALKRPTYGTRRMAAQLTRELGTPINRKRVQKVYRALNWMEPSKRKRAPATGHRNLTRCGRSTSRTSGAASTDGDTSSTSSTSS